MANPDRLSKLRIEALRGVSNSLEIPFEKQMTLIYGENGTGKTTICDALDFLGNGKVGSVTDIGLGSNVHQYWPFLGKNPADILVTLKTNMDTWTATANGRRVAVHPEANRPIVKIWRRNQLFKLIQDAPATRFEVIKPFIDIAEIDRSEQKLRQLRDSLSTSLNEAGIRLAENQESLQELMTVMQGNDADVITWARQVLLQPVNDTDVEIRFLSRTEELLGQLSTAMNHLQTASGNLEQIKTAEASAKDRYELAVSQLHVGAEETLSILQASQSYFHRHKKVEACPLCESKENIEGLPERVDSAIQGFNNLRSAKSNYDSAIQSTKRALEKSSEAEESLNTVRTQLRVHYNDREIPNELATCFEDSPDHDYRASIENLETFKDQLFKSKQALASSKANRETLERALQQYDNNLELQAESAQGLPVVQHLLAIHEIERKAFIDSILDSIAGEVGRMYESIHSGEGLNQIALKLQAERRASLDIASGFLNTEVPPGAYLSNSHIDSLGLCILIALAKLDQPENTILVMDDILGSIDEPHFDRMVRLIYDESANFMQTVVTTHYQAWHHKIRRGQLRNTDCSLIELRKWNAQNGVSIQASARPLVEILRANITNNPTEVEPIAANAGHLLEQVGDFLTMKYQCSVPRREAGNTLNDYLDGLRPNLTNHLKVDIKQADGNYVEIELKPIIDELKTIYQVRNTSGAHYNELAAHLPQSDVLRFGELVLQLCDTIICPQHGLPTKARNGEYWTPPNEQTRRLHPFAKP